MILYHGTNADFGEIDLTKSKPNKDFGQGYYDIVIGPIANDRVGVQLWKYENQSIDLPTLVHNLRNMKGITFQYFFGTEHHHTNN
jgi:hypothetical protein